MRKLTLVAALLVGSSVAFAQFTGETSAGGFKGPSAVGEIGRASCRERV